MSFSSLSNPRSYDKMMNKIRKWGLDYPDAEGVFRRFYTGDQNSYVGYAQVFLALLDEVPGYERPIKVDSMKVHDTIFINGSVVDEDSDDLPEATLKAHMNGSMANVIGEGDGPVNAIDKAIQKALSECRVDKVIPEIGNVKLHDYTVPPTESSGSEAKVQVVGLLGTDGKKITSARSHVDIVAASGLMMLDGYDSLLTQCGYGQKGSHV
ncbi:MAG: hypothetical protein JXC85_06375 [Candidatus Aenigmarchaeota archaeon]|nr:hypothetical protein [Candidatus Aenigmarchaeota archaeon]